MYKNLIYKFCFFRLSEKFAENFKVQNHFLKQEKN